jgi:hypothetical protein
MPVAAVGGFHLATWQPPASRFATTPVRPVNGRQTICCPLAALIEIKTFSSPDLTADARVLLLEWSGVFGERCRP